MSRRNPFEALSQLASQERWCWRMHCSTCGHGQFRWAFRALLNREHPDDPAWPVKKDSRVEDLKQPLGPWPSLGGWPLEEQLALSMLVKGVNTKRLASNGSFPDWLGHLGLALRYTEEYERLQRVLTERLLPQLAQMVRLDSHASQLCRQLLASEERVITWRDLEYFEVAMKTECRIFRDSS